MSKKLYTPEEVARLCDSAFEAGESRGYEASPIEPDEYESIDKYEWCKQNNVLTYFTIDEKEYFHKAE